MFKLLVSMVALIFVTTGCEKKVTQVIQRNDISFYKNVDESSFASSSAPKAIVKIATGRSVGTGFFVNSTGMMITNDHVLGSRNCPRQGCYIEIIKDFEKGASPESLEVFAKPLHANPASDFSIHQLYKTKPKDFIASTKEAGSTEVQIQSAQKIENELLESPNFLTLSTQNHLLQPESQVFTIGHPSGALKKVTTLDFIESSLSEFLVGGPVIGGQSGSPIVNSQGHVLAILKEASVGFSTFSETGLNVYARAVNVEEILQLSKSISRSEATTDFQLDSDKTNILHLVDLERKEVQEDWVENYSLFHRGKVLPDESALAPRSGAGMIEVFFKRCEAYVAQITATEPTEPLLEESEADFCFRTDSLIHCPEDSEDETPKVFWPYVDCPGAEFQKKLGDSFEALFDDNFRTLKRFSSGTLKRVARLRKEPYETLFAQKLETLQPSFTWNLALAILRVEFEKENLTPTYQSVDLVEWFKNYRQRPTYKFQIRALTSGLILIQQAGVDAEAEVKALLADPNVALMNKFSLEILLNNQGLL